MKGSIYVVSLLLSLPDLLAGVTLLVIRHTFSTRNPLQIITDFLFEIVWGLPSSPTRCTRSSPSVRKNDPARRRNECAGTAGLSDRRRPEALQQ